MNMFHEYNECFKYAVARAVHPVDHSAERIIKKLREKTVTLNWEGINFPTPLKDITKFEKQNPCISLNVFGYEGGIYPMRINEKPEGTNHVDLLSIANKEGMQHYCWIKSMSRLLSSQISKNEHKQQYCRRYLNPFRSEDSLKDHVEYCSNNEAVRISYPEKGSDKSILKFKNINRFMRVPFVVYADFEAFIEPIQNMCQRDPRESYTAPYQKHTPSSFCYYIKCFDDDVYSKQPVIVTKEKQDDDIAQIFVDMLEADIKDIYTKFKEKKKMVFNKDDKRNFEESAVCHICKKPFEAGEE